VNGLKKLALMCAQFGGVEFTTQCRVLVNEPRLTQHVRRRVLQLHIHTHTPRTWQRNRRRRV